jgi:glycosyltransferase involved in cell wall biosynthesis
MTEMNKKKVLFFLNKMEIGGAQRVFMRSMEALKNRGYEVKIAFLYSKAGEQELPEGFNIPESEKFYCNAKSIYDYGALKRLQGYVDTEKFDVVLSTLNEANIFARFLKLTRPHLQVTIREANMATTKPLQFKILDILLNLFTHKVIAVSEEVKESLCTYQPFYKSKFVVLENGVVIPKEQKVYSKEMPKPIQILNIGGLTVKKGQKFLIEAVNGILKERPGSVVLKIVGSSYGSTKDEDMLKGMIKEMGRESEITISPFVNPNETTALYQSADLYVLSSLYEGSPNALLKAMANGLATVSTKAGGASTVETPDVGKLVEIGDTKSLTDGILYMLDNYLSWESFGKTAREKMIKDYGFEAHVNTLIRILNI